MKITDSLDTLTDRVEWRSMFGQKIFIILQPFWKFLIRQQLDVLLTPKEKLCTLIVIFGNVKNTLGRALNDGLVRVIVTLNSIVV